jgi:hypothetical protein
MNFACITGMVAAGFLMLMALTGSMLLFFLGLSGFLTCYQTRMNLPLLAERAWEEGQYTSGGYSIPRVGVASARKPKRPRLDDDPTPRDIIRNLNPLERAARARRKKQFQRLFEDDK